MSGDIVVVGGLVGWVAGRSIGEAVGIRGVVRAC